MKIHNSKMQFCCVIKKLKKVIPIIVMILTIAMVATGCGSASDKNSEEITLTPVPIPTPIELPTVFPTPVPAVIPTTSPVSMLTTIPSDDLVTSCTSPDGKYTAVIMNGVLIEVRNSKGEEVTDYNVEDGSANAIMSLDWFNNYLLCIFAHVNPSTSYYCIYDVEQKQVLVEKYGGLFMFMDDDNYESLIYTQAPPHFSDEKHIEKILDINDKVLYEAPEDMIISGLCPDNETGDLAFTTQNIDRENNHLTVLFKADNRQWSIPIDFSSSIKSFSDGQISFMNGSYITINADSDSQTQSASYPQIIDKVSDDLKKQYSDIDFTNEWIGDCGRTVLFGSLKSDPLQGIAVEIDLDNAATRYLAPEKYGAIKAQSMTKSSFAVEVSAENGHVWIYNLYGMGYIDKPSGGVYSGKWEQLERLRYVEGSIVSIEEEEDGTAILNLKIKVNYHGGADPVDNPDFPYMIGGIQEFILQSLPDIKLDKSEDIVVYQTGVIPLSGALDRFVGAVVMYYKKGDKYYDTGNNTVTMPPEDYPQFEQVFNVISK